jgi:hypothetical protein
VREPQAGDGGDLQGPQLDAAMGVLAGAVQHRDLPPRQPDQLGVQGWLVGLDDQQVGGAALDQEAGVVALGVQRVARNSSVGFGLPGGSHREGRAAPLRPVEADQRAGETEGAPLSALAPALRDHNDTFLVKSFQLAPG